MDFGRSIGRFRGLSVVDKILVLQRLSIAPGMPDMLGFRDRTEGEGWAGPCREFEVL